MDTRFIIFDNTVLTHMNVLSYLLTILGQRDWLVWISLKVYDSVGQLQAVSL